MKKRLLAALLLTVTVSLCSCGMNAPATSAISDSEVSVSVSDAEEASTQTSAESGKDEADTEEKDIDNQDKETSEASETSDESKKSETSTNESKKIIFTPTIFEWTDNNFTLDSPSFSKNLRMGWNLGNTLDATASAGLDSETSWGQPKTTQDIIHMIREAGFTTIRIPVSWGKHTSGDNYDVDPEWMARVTEVVDYAMNEGLYVIINSHHDNSYYYPDDAHKDKSRKYIECLWKQVAKNFKDYDERLIFESMNEPRLEGTSIEWWFSPSDPEGIKAIETVAELNQLFVDTVRATGGNNALRYLMVPSAMASPDNALNQAFEMPSDSANHMILSVHAYTPYDFAMNGNGYDKWSISKEGEFSFMMNLYVKFIKNGYGVVIGEMGATNKNNLESRVSWANGYARNAALKGISCIWWDNGATGYGEENFGLMNRNMLMCSFPEILEALLKNYQD